MDLICRAHQVRVLLRSILATVCSRALRGTDPSDLSRVPLLGRRGRVRVLRKATLGHPILRTQLLWRVRQCRSDDERRRDAAVFLPGVSVYIWVARVQRLMRLCWHADPEACREEGKVSLRRCKYGPSSNASAQTEEEGREQNGLRDCTVSTYTLSRVSSCHRRPFPPLYWCWPLVWLSWCMGVVWIYMDLSSDLFASRRTAATAWRRTRRRTSRHRVWGRWASAQMETRWRRSDDEDAHGRIWTCWRHGPGWLWVGCVDCTAEAVGVAKLLLLSTKTTTPPTRNTGLHCSHSICCLCKGSLSIRISLPAHTLSVLCFSLPPPGILPHIRPPSCV